MQLRDILLVFDGSPRDDATLAVALGLARRDGARQTGLCALERLVPAGLSYALGGCPDLWALPVLMSH